MSFTLMQLPFETDALEPVISQETIDYHYGKHHRKYVDTLSTLVREENGLADAGVRHMPASSARCSTMRHRFGTTISTGIRSRRRQARPRGISPG